MAEQMKWGVLGTGKITTRFAQALNNIPEQAELLAVGSRNQKRSIYPWMVLTVTNGKRWR